MSRLALAFALFAAPATAQVIICAPYADMTGMLAARLGETRMVTGLDPRGMIIETFGNADTGTWSLISITPDMNACVIASGQLLQLSLTAQSERS